MRFLKPLIGLILVLSLIFNVIMYVKIRRGRAIFTVNGSSVSKAEMDDYLERQGGPAFKAMKVQQILVDQEAHRQGVAPTDQEVDEEFNTRKEMDWQFAQRLARYPDLAAAAKGDIRRDLEMRYLLVKDIPVTDEEIKVEYNTNPWLYDAPNKAHAEVAVLLNETHADEIRQLMSKNDPPLLPATILQQFPREVVFLGENNQYTFIQYFGRPEMNAEIFRMAPKSVAMMGSGSLSQLGAKKLVVRLIEIIPGHKADLNDPKTLKKIKLNVALRRSRPPLELLSQLWANARFESDDSLDRTRIESQLFPERAQGEAHAENTAQ